MKTFSEALRYLALRIVWSVVVILPAAGLVWAVARFGADAQEAMLLIGALFLYALVCIGWIVAVLVCGIRFTLKAQRTAKELFGILIADMVVLVLVAAVSAGGLAVFAKGRVLALLCDTLYFLELVGYCVVAAPALFCTVTGIAVCLRRKRRVRAALLVLYAFVLVLLSVIQQILFLGHAPSTRMLDLALSIVAVLLSATAVGTACFCMIVRGKQP